ncbi:hydroxyethylthiazole kinase [Bifidobacterium subtile]|jgi:hydroxyethylthiazole kinase|uniref:hydroxyethylthiazole kinase n=1 Tax=Bifidobacterium subtile TaxID=77635 RepID=UPI002F3580F8
MSDSANPSSTGSAAIADDAYRNHSNVSDGREDIGQDDYDADQDDCAACYAANHNDASQALSKVPPHSELRARIRQAVEAVKTTRPLAPSFTNFVTMNLVANAQLAVGGSAAMSLIYDEVVDMTAIAGASYVNVGTLQPFYREELAKISQFWRGQSHHWVLDPVGAGAGSTRTAILESFRTAPPTVVRANASEILALCSIWKLHDDATDTSAATRPAGVESVDDVDDAQTAAMTLARFLAAAASDGKAAVAVSGAVDLVTDGTHAYRLPGGSAMMTRITGAGCSLGGVLACYLAVSDPLTAALAASLLYNRASERAERASDGPGTFQSAFLDALYAVSADAVAASPVAAVPAEPIEPSADR